jgi:hypothetical protein
VESLVLLSYPNGQGREETLRRNRALRPGDEFVLYGRRWRAIGPAPVGRYVRKSGRILCTSTGRVGAAAVSVPVQGRVSA